MRQRNNNDSRFVAKLLCIILMSTPAHAIMTRHDVEQVRYHALDGEFPGLVKIYPDMGLGVLIDPLWVLTAAHVVMCMYPGETIDVGGTQHLVEHVIWNPQVHGQPPQLDRTDLALLKLQSAATQRPVKLYRQFDEVDKVAWFYGSGATGTGDVGDGDPPMLDGVLRKAQNRVEMANQGWLKFVFDEPAGRAEPLEGISGIGDSGGPAYLKSGRQWLLAGISAWQDWDLARADGISPGSYGVNEYYVRVSEYADWVDAVLAYDQAALLAVSRRWTIPPTIPIDSDQLQEYEGTYALADDYHLQVTVERGQLFVQGQAKNQLVAGNDGWFYYQRHPIKLRFQSGANGEVSHLIWNDCGETTAPKLF